MSDIYETWHELHATGDLPILEFVDILPFIVGS